MRSIADAERSRADGKRFGGMRVEAVISFVPACGTHPLRSSHDGIDGRTGGGIESVIGRIDDGGGGEKVACDGGATEIGAGSRMSVPSSAYCSPGWGSGRTESGAEGAAQGPKRWLFVGRGMPSRVWLSKERSPIKFTHGVKLQ
jgi:hypothetical protein